MLVAHRVVHLLGIPIPLTTAFALPIERPIAKQGSHPPRMVKALQWCVDHEQPARNIVGAGACEVEAPTRRFAGLPEELAAAICIVRHISPQMPSQCSPILKRACRSRRTRFCAQAFRALILDPKLCDHDQKD
jgi:hypothetical protein